MCYKYTLKLMENGTKMVRLDIMSRHDRKKQWYLAFGHDVQTVTDNLTFYTSTIERNGGIKVNRLTDYQNQQMEKMLEFLRGIDLSQEEIQMLI